MPQQHAAHRGLTDRWAAAKPLAMHAGIPTPR